MWCGRLAAMSLDDHHEWLARFDAATGDGLDPVAMAELVSVDHRQVDHRAVGWEPVEGREAMLAWARSIEAILPRGLRVERELVLVDGDLHVAREVLRGKGLGEIEAELEWWAVRRIRDGAAQRCDVFGGESEAAAFARSLATSGT
jgi:hypothetical protein